MVRSSDGSVPTRFTRSGRRIVSALAVIVLNTVLLAGSTATAASENHPEPDMRLTVSESGMTVQDGSGELNLTELVPGRSEHRTVLVTNDTDARIRLGLGVAGLDEYENGCVPPERTVDGSCASEDGELGAALRISAKAEGAAGRAHSIPVRAAVDRDLPLPAIEPGGSSRIGVTLAVPQEVDNRIQSDRALFDLVWRATGTVGSVDASVPVSSESGGSPDSSFLARTGVSVPALLGVGLLTLIAGAFAVWFGRARGRVRRHE